jgi:hypothetical protein
VRVLRGRADDVVRDDRKSPERREGDDEVDRAP